MEQLTAEEILALYMETGMSQFPLRKPLKEYEKDIIKTFGIAYKTGAQDINIYSTDKPVFKIKGFRTKVTNLPEWTNETFDVFVAVVVNSLKEVYDLPEEDSYRYLGEQDGDSVFEEYSQDDLDIILEYRLQEQCLDTFTREISKKRKGSYDFNLSFEENYLRIHLFCAEPKGGFIDGRFALTQACMSVRVVPKEIPKLEKLNLPDISGIFAKKRGLVLVSGDTGEGKSTTVAGIVNEFNESDDKIRNILTIEEPIEYIHNNKNACIVQRRVGDDGHVASYAKATEDALREDVDIVVLGELRKADEMYNALRLAEVGKLVIASIHGTEISDTIERCIGEFKGEDKINIREKLLSNLLAIVHQTLIIAQDGLQYPLASVLLIDNEEKRDMLKSTNDRAEIDTLVGKIGTTKKSCFYELVNKGFFTIEDDESRFVSYWDK